jgi:hypothetical protein
MEEQNLTPPILDECAPLIAWAKVGGLADQMHALYQAISSSTDYIGKAIIRDLEEWGSAQLTLAEAEQDTKNVEVAPRVDLA